MLHADCLPSLCLYDHLLHVQAYLWVQYTSSNHYCYPCPPPPQIAGKQGRAAVVSLIDASPESNIGDIRLYEHVMFCKGVFEFLQYILDITINVHKFTVRISEAYINYWYIVSFTSSLHAIITVSFHVITVLH